MNNIETLREHLFATLAGLRDKSMDVERAKAISEVSQVIINTAKVEVDHARALGGKVTGTKFLTDQATLPTGVTSITQHRIGG